MNILLPCGHESDFLNKECLPCSKYKDDPKFKELCEKLNAQRLKAQEPNIIEKVINAAEAGIKYVKSGSLEFLKEAIYKDRIDKCSTCTENKNGVCVAIDKDTGKACGCFVSIKAKIPTEDCPMGKWPRINLDVVQGKCGGCGSK